MESNEYKYIEDLKNHILNNLSALEILDITDKELEKLIFPTIEYTRTNLLYKLRKIEVKAIDAFNKTFTIYKDDIFYLNKYMDKIIQLKLDNPNIPLKNILLISDIRFSVLYRDNPQIVDVPSDIFRFLIKNKYDDSILDCIIRGGFDIRYNYIEIFKSMIKIGKSFQEKAALVGDTNDTNVVTYLINKLNNIKASEIHSEFCKKYGGYNYNDMARQCSQNKICFLEALYKVLYKDISIDDAIQLGIKEKQKYGISDEIDESMPDQRFLIKVFFGVVREHIKNNNLEY